MIVHLCPILPRWFIYKFLCVIKPFNVVSKIAILWLVFIKPWVNAIFTAVEVLLNLVIFLVYELIWACARAGGSEHSLSPSGTDLRAFCIFTHLWCLFYFGCRSLGVICSFLFWFLFTIYKYVPLNSFAGFINF